MQTIASTELGITLGPYERIVVQSTLSSKHFRLVLPSPGQTLQQFLDTTPEKNFAGRKEAEHLLRRPFLLENVIERRGEDANPAKRIDFLGTTDVCKKTGALYHPSLQHDGTEWCLAFIRDFHCAQYVCVLTKKPPL